MKRKKSVARDNLNELEDRLLRDRALAMMGPRDPLLQYTDVYCNLVKLSEQIEVLDGGGPDEDWVHAPSGDDYVDRYKIRTFISLASRAMFR